MGGERHNRQRGMTLIEVLVALAILGAVAGAILSLIGQNTRFVAAAEDRLVASILLDNLMTEELARSDQPEAGESETARDFAGRDWRVRRTVTDIGIERTLRIDIEIQGEGGQTLAAASTLRRERRL